MILALALAGLVAFLLLMVLTDTALSVWSRLAELPWWLRTLYFTLLAFFSLAAMLLAWRWLQPRRRPADERADPGPLSRESVASDIVDSARQGVDVADALRELEEHRRRKESGEVHIAVFGEVSTGKSSLVRALLPGANADTDPRAGTTRHLRQYRWQSASGDEVILTDLPGFNLGDADSVIEEARRAHLVVFLCDGELTASQHRELSRLRELGKPVVLALNKSDRYSAEETAAILDRLTRQTGISREDIVTIRTGGREQVIRVLSDGREESASREREVDVEPLRQALQSHLDRNMELMESLQDSAVLLLASEKLDSARLQHRAREAEGLVRKYSKRAVIGALAAVAPGSDLVIQGVLATRLVQELCNLYGVSVKEVQIESFLKLAGGKVRKMSALTFAIAGNALKAFPGLGTLSGGLLHAVAYGMIFDSLGRAAAETLASRGELRPAPAAAAFEDLLRENLETRADRFARLAITAGKDRDAT